MHPQSLLAILEEMLHKEMRTANLSRQRHHDRRISEQDKGDAQSRLCKEGRTHRYKALPVKGVRTGTMNGEAWSGLDLDLNRGGPWWIRPEFDPNKKKMQGLGRNVKLDMYLNKRSGTRELYITLSALHVQRGANVPGMESIACHWLTP